MGVGLNVYKSNCQFARALPGEGGDESEEKVKVPDTHMDMTCYGHCTNKNPCPIGLADTNP